MQEYLNADQREYFLSTLPVIRRTVNRYRNKDPLAENEDITQDVILGLLTWKRNRPDREYSMVEWLRLAHRAARNRTFRYRRRGEGNEPLPENDTQALPNVSSRYLSINPLHGNTNMELHPLVAQIWQIVKAQSFIENYALLLKSDELTLQMLFYRGCEMEELAVLLQLTGDELKWILRQLPLSDIDISGFLRDTFEVETTPGALRKARQRAKNELQNVLKVNLQVGRKSRSLR